MPWWTIAFWTMLLGVATFAFARGGVAERRAAAMLLAAALATVMVRSAASVRYGSVETGIVVVDLLLLVGLVALSVRSDRRWPIALAVLQAVTVLGHLGKRLDPDLWRLGYAIMITAPAYPGLLVLAVGILRHAPRTRRSRSVGI